MSRASAATTVGVADDEADAPARHRVALRQGVELHRDLACPGRLEDRRRAVAVEGDVGVREVVHEHELALPAKSTTPCLKSVTHGRGRVVRERQDDDARAWPRALVRVGEVREDVLVGAHRDLRDARAGQHGREEVDRVARLGTSATSPGSTSTQSRCARPSLAPMVDRLRLGVELHAEAAPVQLADGCAQVGDPAARRVAVVARLAGGLGELLDGDVGRGRSGLPKPRSTTSSPARRSSSFSPSISAKA